MKESHVTTYRHVAKWDPVVELKQIPTKIHIKDNKIINKREKKKKMKELKNEM